MNSNPANPVNPNGQGAAGEGVSAVSAAASPTFSPLYQQIKGLITQSLESGEWKPGEIIPSEVELAARFKVSQGTVRKAIDELAADNLLVRRQGKGTFVATHNEERAQFRFLRLLADDGAEHPHVSRLLECRRLRASAEIARQLDLKPADPVVLIKRLLQFDGEVTVLDEIWLPGAVFRGLTLERLSEYKGPLYAMFETEFGTRMIRATEKSARSRRSLPWRTCCMCRRVFRCSRSSACPIPMGTGRLKSGEVGMSQPGITIRTI